MKDERACARGRRNDKASRLRSARRIFGGVRETAVTRKSPKTRVLGSLSATIESQLAAVRDQLITPLSTHASLSTRRAVAHRMR